MITPRLMTLSELDEAAPEREWGPWTLDAEHFVLDNAVGYDVDLERCLSSAQVLDYVAQVAGKSWADDATLAGRELVAAFDREGTHA